MSATEQYRRMGRLLGMQYGAPKEPKLVLTASAAFCAGLTLLATQAELQRLPTGLRAIERCLKLDDFDRQWCLPADLGHLEQQQPGTTAAARHPQG
jgi:hypothetical protein